MRKIHLLLLGLLVLGGVIGCSKNDVGADPNAVYTSNLADIKEYAASKGLSGTSTSSGLYYVTTRPASASAMMAAIGQEAEFNYVMYALIRNGSNVVTDRKADSLYVTNPVYYILSDYTTQSSFIPLLPGLLEGITKMREGEQATMLLPSSLAFGDQSVLNGLVPANTPVRFDVTLRRSRTEDQQINEYLTANKLTPTEVTISGLRFIKTLDNPSGTTPTTVQQRVVRYKGKLLRSASAFDSTGTGTAAFTLGNSIPGFDEGLAKLKVGEKATLVMPSKLGYGTIGNRVIPPYAPLRFDIELVSVQ